MPQQQLRISITGPESTGKSTLAEQLANYYQVQWVPEYARDYLNQLNRAYTQADVEQIALGQLARMQVAAAHQAGDLLFFDTDLLVLKVWMQHAYGACPGWLLRAITDYKQDLYLLMNVDLPWEPDPQREHPDLRQFFYDWYKRELMAYGFAFVEISGSYAARFQAAQQQVESLRNNKLIT